MSVEGKVFVVTGAASGIGLATARLAAQRGASVVLSDIHDDAGQEAAEELAATYGSAVYVHCDVSDEGQVQELMEKAAAAFGGVDVLHNNAGIHEAMISQEFAFETMPVAVFDRVMSVNLRGAFLCSQKALPYLKASSRGPCIVNAGSTASFVGYPYGLAYGSSKGAITLLTKNLAVALAPYGIRVNCYCPASVDTGMVRDVSASIGQRAAQLAGNVPATSTEEPVGNDAHLAAHLVRRIGDPSDIAELVCFLSSDAASFVNGAVWLIDGGVLAWRDTVESLGLGSP